MAPSRRGTLAATLDELDELDDHLAGLEDHPLLDGVEGLVAATASPGTRGTHARWRVEVMVADGDVVVPEPLAELPRLVVGELDDLATSRGGLAPSIGTRGGLAGTMTGRVLGRDGVVGLTAGHVLALRGGQAPVGEAIWTPAPRFGFTAAPTRIGRVRWINALASRRNTADVGLFDLEPPAETGEDVIDLAASAAPTILPGVDVTMRGCASGARSGRVTRVGGRSVRVNVMGHRHRFDGLFAVEPADGSDAFARPGDSGALVRLADGRSAGMVLAGSASGSTSGGPLAWVTPSTALADTVAQCP